MMYFVPKNYPCGTPLLHLDDSISIIVMLIPIKFLLKWLNKLRTQQHGWHFGDDIFKSIFPMKFMVFWYKFHRSLFPKIQLVIHNHWFRKWLAAEEATIQYLRQRWPSPMAHIYIHPAFFEWLHLCFPIDMSGFPGMNGEYTIDPGTQRGLTCQRQ